MILCDTVDDLHEFFDLFIGDSDLHALSAQYIGRTHQYGIAQSVSNRLSFLCGVYSTAGCTGDLGLFQNLVEQFSILSGIYILRLGAQDGHAHLHQALGKLDSGLSAELYHSTIGMLNIYDRFHIFRSQRLEIQLVRNIEVGTYSLRVVVDDNGLIACLGKCPGSMYGTIVELDTLSDTDRTGTQYQDFLASGGLLGFALAAEYGVIIRSGSCELCGTGVYHLVNSLNAVVITHLLDLFLGLAGQSCDDVIRELDSLGFLQQIHCQGLCLQCMLHLGQNGDLVNEPQVDLCNVVDLFITDTLTDCFSDHIDSLVIHDLQTL